MCVPPDRFDVVGLVEPQVEGCHYQLKKETTVSLNIFVSKSVKNLVGNFSAIVLSLFNAETRLSPLQFFNRSVYVNLVFRSTITCAYFIPPGAVMSPYVMSICATLKKNVGHSTGNIFLVVLYKVLTDPISNGISPASIIVTVGLYTCLKCDIFLSFLKPK